MQHRRTLIGAVALMITSMVLPALAPKASATRITARPTITAPVTIDGVGLIPAKSNHYTTVLHLRQYGAFVAIYHTSYRGSLKAHISIDRNHRTIYRNAMASTVKGRAYFYVWIQFHNRSHIGRLVAYITIQAGSTKIMKELPFTLQP